MNFLQYLLNYEQTARVGKSRDSLSQPRDAFLQWKICTKGFCKKLLPTIGYKVGIV